MSKKLKTILTILIVIIISITIYLKFIKKPSIEIPKITLNGKNIITINQGQNYKEPGYKATDSKDGNLTDKVKINGKVLTNKIEHMN